MSKNELTSPREKDSLGDTNNNIGTTLKLNKNTKGKRNFSSTDIRHSSDKLQVVDDKFIKKYKVFMADKYFFDDDEITDLDATISTIEMKNSTTNSISTTAEEPSESYKKYLKNCNHDQQLMKNMLKLDIKSDLNDFVEPIEDQTNDLTSFKSLNHFSQIKASSFDAKETVDNDNLITNDSNACIRKDEFFKYLEIDTNPKDCSELHDAKPQENDTIVKRRSFRLRLQKIAKIIKK